MSNNAPNWYTHEFNRQVNFYYQSMGWELKSLITPPAKIEGSKLYFPYMGEFQAYKAVRNAASPDIHVSQDLLEITWDHYEVQRTSLQIDLDKSTIEQNAKMQMGMAMALGRLHTSQIVAKICADAKAASQNTGAYNTAWSLANASTAVATLFDRVESDAEMAICLLPYAQFQQMMAEPEFSSSDFNGPDLPFIRKGMKKTWNGCHWYAMPKRKGKVDPIFPLANTTELDFPMWVPSAFGSGSGFNDIRTYVAHDIKKQAGAWDHKAVAGWGFLTLQVAGMQNCKVQETSAISYA